MSQPFVHLELNTPDLAKAKDFYGQLCGWTYTDTPMPDGNGVYSLFKAGNGPGGGMMSMKEAPTAWLPYIGVDNLKASTDKAASLGAKIIMREQEVPGMGWFSILIDPTGVNIALWQAKAA